jgi:hypothetical protein
VPTLAGIEARQGGGFILPKITRASGQPQPREPGVARVAQPVKLAIVLQLELQRRGDTKSKHRGRTLLRANVLMPELWLGESPRVSHDSLLNRPIPRNHGIRRLHVSPSTLDKNHRPPRARHRVFSR